MTAMSTSFVTRHRAHATHWKRTALPVEAHAAASYAGKGSYEFCLPAHLAAENLLPSVRSQALALFAELGIPWHRGVRGGPTNHLVSSQVQCVNAMPMVQEPERVVRAFGSTLDIGEVLTVETGRFLTFEFISPTDYLAESINGRPRTRGANCTSIDAAFAYRTRTGETELALIEWKFTESYSTPHAPDKTAVRERRYRHLVEAAGSPIRPGVPFEWLLDEPFYQLMRQQILARALETDPSTPWSRVRILHVLDPANAAYERSVVNRSMKGYGGTVGEIWAWLLASPDRFHHVEPTVFLDPAITSAAYGARYALT